MRPERLFAAAALVVIAGCDTGTVPGFPGSTEWDRNVVLAEASERVTDWLVAEGDRVAAGDLLLRLDGARFEARIDQAAARLAEAEARLAELRHGPRAETIARASAELASADAAVVEAELDYERAALLLRRGLTSQSSVDGALAARDQRRAQAAANRAALDELLAGTRREQIEQAEARVAGLVAELEELRLTRQRLEVRAPRDGRVDALPFRPGDQPRVGDELVTLLIGDRPFARVFVPASARAAFSIGDPFELRVEGIDDPFEATLRSIRGEASFTPYYALTGDDASRLVYRAELVFDEARAAGLPAGLPLVAMPAGPGGAAAEGDVDG